MVRDMQKPWIGLIGPPGICKTRCLSLFLSSLIESGKKCRFVNASDLSIWASRQYFDDRCNDYRRGIEAIISAEAILLNDLGKIKSTQAVVEVFYRLLENRYREDKTMLWSSNLFIEESLASFPNEYRDSMGGRLLEASEIFEM